MDARSNDLFAVAQRLLEAADASLADSMLGPIAYKAVCQGLPVFDCPPALYVSLGGIAVADTLPGGPSLIPLQRMVTTGIVDIDVMSVTVIRCVSAKVEGEGQNAKLPPAVNVTADAQESYSDLWAIWNGLKSLHRSGLLFQVPSGRREFGFDPAFSVRTAGGAMGWIVNVRVQIPGYESLVTIPPEVTP